MKKQKGILQINNASSLGDAEDKVVGIREIPGHVFSHIIEANETFTIHSIFKIEGKPKKTQRTVYWIED